MRGCGLASSLILAVVVALPRLLVRLHPGFERRRTPRNWPRHVDRTVLVLVSVVDALVVTGRVVVVGLVLVAEIVVVRFGDVVVLAVLRLVPANLDLPVVTGGILRANPRRLNGRNPDAVEQ